MTDQYTLISELFGKTRSEARPPSTTTSTIMGTAVSDSANGSVDVELPGDVTGGEGNVVTLPTEAHILKGDVVSVTLVGGVAKAARVTGTVGGGDRIYASLVETEQLIATKADVTDLTAATGRIETLETNALTADSAVITDLQSEAAKIEDLTANELSAATGYIADLTAGNLTAQNLIADHQTIGSLDTDEIAADHATIAALDTNYAQIDLANIANGTIKTAMIDDGQITSAKILDGTIANADIANGTIQNAKIKDGTIQNAKIANGTIETAKIKDGAITNAKIADATIDSAKITNLTGTNGWIDRLMVQTGLLANSGTVFTLDAIQVNANSITAGTIDIERIVVTDSTTGDKHMVTWNDSTSSWDAVKLDGDVLEDRTIAADKIVAHSLTVQEITTQNLVGTGGWINLAAGTFQYVNATTGDGISWDGSNLTINAAGLMTTIAGTYATQSDLTAEANARKAVYGTSSTGAATQAKAVTCANFTRYTGAEVTVKFANANTYNGTPKLNVNSTGAAEIRSYTGAALTKEEREWAAGSTMTFSFDGTYWRMLDNGMTGRMSTAETSISQNATNIALKANASDVYTQTQANALLEVKANKDTLTSEINASADTVQIDASRVNISGAALFTSGRLSESSLDAAYDANGAAAAANDQEQLIFKSAASGTSSMSSTTTWVSDATGAQGTWTIKRPQYSSSYPVLFVATQRKTVGGTVTCTTPLIDDTTTVIDGGSIITNSVTASKLDAASINASNSLTVGALTSEAQASVLNSPSIRFSMRRDNYDDATWATYGAAGYADNWTNRHYDASGTASATGFDGTTLMVGDIILAEGISKDSKSAHTITCKVTAVPSSSNGAIPLVTLGMTDSTGRTVGGRNLLRGTGDATNANWARSNGTYVTIPEDGVLRIAPTSTGNMYAKYIVDYLDYAEYLDGQFTVSFEAMLSDETTEFSTSDLRVYFGFSIASRTSSVFAAVSDRFGYIVLSSDVPSTWTRFSATFDVSKMTSGAAAALVAGSNLTVEPYVSKANKPVLIRKLKLERGNVATDWTPAPEDSTAYADSVADSIRETGITLTQRVYRRTASSAQPDAPSELVIEDGDVYDAWTLKVPPMASGDVRYPYLWTCEQSRTGNGSLSCTAILLDDSSTVIDGGSIISNSITVNKLQSGTLALGNMEQSVLDAIEAAGKTATDYLAYADGALTLGTNSENAPKAQLTNAQLRFMVENLIMAYLGQNPDSEAWEMVIEQARISDMLHFGKFAWIKRANGNMSLKWIGGDE